MYTEQNLTFPASFWGEDRALFYPSPEVEEMQKNVKMYKKMSLYAVNVFNKIFIVLIKWMINYQSSWVTLMNQSFSPCIKICNIEYSFSSLPSSAIFHYYTVLNQFFKTRVKSNDTRQFNSTLKFSLMYESFCSLKKCAGRVSLIRMLTHSVYGRVLPWISLA